MALEVLLTFEQRVCTYVTESEADDRGLVQVGSNGGRQRQQTGQVSEHVRLNPSSLPGCLAADRPAVNRERESLIITVCCLRDFAFMNNIRSIQKAHLIEYQSSVSIFYYYQ